MAADRGDKFRKNVGDQGFRGVRAMIGSPGFRCLREPRHDFATELPPVVRLDERKVKVAIAYDRL